MLELGCMELSCQALVLASSFFFDTLSCMSVIVMILGVSFREIPCSACRPTSQWTWVLRDAAFSNSSSMPQSQSWVGLRSPYYLGTKSALDDLGWIFLHLLSWPLLFLLYLFSQGWEPLLGSFQCFSSGYLAVCLMQLFLNVHNSDIFLLCLGKWRVVGIVNNINNINHFSTNFIFFKLKSIKNPCQTFYVKVPSCFICQHCIKGLLCI